MRFASSAFSVRSYTETSAFLPTTAMVIASTATSPNPIIIFVVIDIAASVRNTFTLSLFSLKCLPARHVIRSLALASERRFVALSPTRKLDAESPAPTVGITFHADSPRSEVRLIARRTGTQRDSRVEIERARFFGPLVQAIRPRRRRNTAKAPQPINAADAGSGTLAAAVGPV